MKSSRPSISLDKLLDLGIFYADHEINSDNYVVLVHCPLCQTGTPLAPDKDCPVCQGEGGIQYSLVDVDMVYTGAD